MASLAQRAHVTIDWSWHEITQRVDFEITLNIAFSELAFSEFCL